MKRELAESEAAKYSKEWDVPLTVIQTGNKFSYKRTSEVVEGDVVIQTFEGRNPNPQAEAVTPKEDSFISRLFKRKK